jgi:CheY-like chemotaxis protein
VEHPGSSVSQHPDALQGVPVLVVDDNARNRLLLVEMLRRVGMKPAPAKDGRAALEQLRIARLAGSAFPLILLDLHMPEMDGMAVAERLGEDSDFGRPRVILMTAAGSSLETVRARELGIGQFLIKPVLAAELLETVQLVLSAEAAAPVPAVKCDIPGSDQGEGGLLILLAEDNRVNQLLAVRLIEKRGHKVVVAENGREALSMIDRERFDLVLLDVQMPEMDGFSVARIIREREQSTREHLPLIALTANSMSGDRERCLAAGMDDYISKPIDSKELFHTVERCISGNRTAFRSHHPVQRV